jgi:exodeoxyribonuclease VII small subunit
LLKQKVMKKNTNDKLPDFEKSLEELESLVVQLESGDLSLDQSLSQFKRGVELTRHCQGVLDEAQQLVQKLMDTDDESSTVPFDTGG